MNKNNPCAYLENQLGILVRIIWKIPQNPVGEHKRANYLVWLTNEFEYSMNLNTDQVEIFTFCPKVTKVE